MRSVAEYQNILNEFLSKINIPTEPKNLYEPITYILSIGGKRMRPILTLMGAEIFGAKYEKAFQAAAAVELFHNFSLIHDDIMDDAPLRRGNQTVHEKWNVNTGILSGDALLILAYQFFENYDPHIFRSLAKIFSKTALEVCEGQQLDVDFEQRDDVTIDEYIVMIKYKTAVLVGAALKMGAVVAETSEKNANLIYDFGLNLGIAFQLQDDYLDAFGDPLTFGKQVGGDIIENKKTYLYLKALELADSDSKNQLQNLFSIKPVDPKQKIESVKQYFLSTGAALQTQELIEKYTLAAFKTLEDLDVVDQQKQSLIDFGNLLMKRNV